MLTDYLLSFPSGSLITGVLLKKMYEYPKELIHGILTEYSEGVISGLNINYKNHCLTLSSGIYKHNSSLYILEEDTVIANKINFQGAKWYAILEEKSQENNNILTKHLNVKIQNLNNEEFTKLTNDNLLLFSFKHEPNFPSCADAIKTGVYNFLDYKQAYRGTEPTFTPQIFNLVYKKLSSKRKTGNPLDYVIMNEILARGSISCELMRTYIRCSNQSIPTDREHLMIVFLDAISKSQESSSDNDKNVNTLPRNWENESCLL